MVYVFVLGNLDISFFVVGFFGGFYGFERIGVGVVLVYLCSLVSCFLWDSVLYC